MSRGLVKMRNVSVMICMGFGSFFFSGHVIKKSIDFRDVGESSKTGLIFLKFLGS